jgi:hypothetical protein
MTETVIILILLGIGLFYTETIETQKFFNTQDGYLLSLKEKDYDFLLMAKYGEKVEPNKVFMTRVKNAFYSGLFLMGMMVVAGSLSFLNVIIVLVLTYVIFKSGYSNLKSYYKKYMAQIDLLLPYYLKNLEILCQNYTVPVALARSIDTAPEVFKPGLRQMVAKIDAGDSSIQPYMDFAIMYPVRDSMRMMRLLYRLGLGAQENKYKQLLIFSKSVSSLQNKAREVKYKQRLDAMEQKTMIMLVVTGGGTMVVLVMSMMMSFGG